MSRIYGPRDVTAMTGISTEVLRAWRFDAANPFDLGERHGYSHKFSIEEVVTIALAKEIADNKITVAEAFGLLKSAAVQKALNRMASDGGIALYFLFIARDAANGIVKSALHISADTESVAVDLGKLAFEPGGLTSMPLRTTIISINATWSTVAVRHNVPLEELDG